MSTDEDIRSVYEQDIHEKTRVVLARKGVGALLEGSSGMHIESMFGEATGDGTAVRDFRTSRERD